MCPVTLKLSGGEQLRCPPVVTDRYLTELLKLPSVTLGRTTSLRSGSTLRGFRTIARDDQLCDLTRYDDLFASNRQWYGHIKGA